MAHTKPPQRRQEGSKRLRGGRDQIEFIDLGSVSLLRSVAKSSQGLLWLLFLPIGFYRIKSAATSSLCQQ